jgi:hypothetical protein
MKMGSFGGNAVTSIKLPRSSEVAAAVQEYPRRIITVHLFTTIKP